MRICLYGKFEYMEPSALEYQIIEKGIVCTSSNSSIDDWIDDGEIFTSEDSSDF